MKESYLWECVACCTLPYDRGGAPYHTAEVLVVCDDIETASKELEREIYRKCEKYQLKFQDYQVTTLKRGLRVVVPETK